MSEVLEKNIPNERVAREYLKIEFSKLFPNKEMRKYIETTVDELKEKHVWTYLQAMSFTVGLNGVFYKIGSNLYTWNKEIVDLRKIKLTGMSTALNKIIFSEEIDRDPLKFKNFLVDYYNSNKDADPLDLRFKPSKERVEFPLFATEKDSKLYILDGSHRLMTLLFDDVYEFETYVGRELKENKEKEKVKMGISSFIFLREIYINSKEEEIKEAVVKTTIEAAKRAIDAKEAIEKYWIIYPSDEGVKEAGRRILNELENNM